MTKYKLWVLLFRGQAVTRCHKPVSAQGMDTILFFVSFMRDRVQVWNIIYDDGTIFFETFVLPKYWWTSIGRRSYRHILANRKRLPISIAIGRSGNETV